MAVASAVPFPPCPGPPQDWTVGCPYFAGLVLSCVQASVGERQRAIALSYSRKDEDCASPKLAGNKRQPVTYPTQFFFFLIGLRPGKKPVAILIWVGCRG